MECSYCGVSTNGTNHQNTRDCVEALANEVERLRAALRSATASSAKSRQTSSVVRAVAPMVAGSSAAPSITVSRIQAGFAELFVMVVADGDSAVPRAVGPFSEEDCRIELAQLGIPPAAIEMRMTRARQAIAAE